MLTFSPSYSGITAFIPSHASTRLGAKKRTQQSETRPNPFEVLNDKKLVVVVGPADRKGLASELKKINGLDSSYHNSYHELQTAPDNQQQGDLYLLELDPGSNQRAALDYARTLLAKNINPKRILFFTSGSENGAVLEEEQLHKWETNFRTLDGKTIMEFDLVNFSVPKQNKSGSYKGGDGLLAAHILAAEAEEA